MTKKVIEINNLYKEYQLGVIGRDTFYRDFQSFIAKIQNKPDPNSTLNTPNSDTNKKFLALKNINLDVFEGEVLGIIGRNGAGKSTLLKLLSRITSPSKGEIKIKGKIASLLEVGTGFHGELTGRENIYLNGAINGMNISETEKQIDNIISFSGILQEHIDTPVKRYSSGMIVKLGFSVAAFLDYDILVCDEVLAVGDLEFQKKALSKVKEINFNSNRTVLFVSHNMESIQKICNRVIILNEGEIKYQGKTNEMVSKYSNNLSFLKNYEKVDFTKKKKRYISKDIELISISSTNEIGELCKDFNVNENIFIEVTFNVLNNNKFSCCLFFYKKNKFIFQSIDESRTVEWGSNKILNKGKYKKICKLPRNFFDTGEIDINLIIFSPPGDIENSSHIVVPEKEIGILTFNITDNDNLNSSKGSYPFSWREDSILRPNLSWETKNFE